MEDGPLSWALQAAWELGDVQRSKVGGQKSEQKRYEGRWLVGDHGRAGGDGEQGDGAGQEGKRICRPQGVTRGFHQGRV